jgi:hypothetical protein
MTASLPPPQFDDDIAVDFSFEELLALSRTLVLPPLAGLGADPLKGLDEQALEPLLDAARRSLVARKVITVDDAGTESVIDGVGRIMSIATAPAVFARVQLEQRGLVESRAFAAVPGVTIEHRPLVGGVHRLVAFDTDELLLRIIGATNLEARPSISAPPFETSVRTLLEFEASILEQRVDDAVHLLGRDGVPEEPARAFALALGHKVRAARVVIVHRPTETVIAGGELTWLDCGDEGLWLVPTPDLPPDADAESDAFDLRIEVEPTTRERIVGELISYLPQQEG